MFNRAENLARHYKSKRGSRCVPPDGHNSNQVLEEVRESPVGEELETTQASKHADIESLTLNI